MQQETGLSSNQHPLGKAISPIKSLTDQERLHAGRLAGDLLLKMTGEDLQREGLRDTPQRHAKAFDFLTSGYRLTLRQAVGNGIFPSESRGLVAVNDIEYFSMCEHHLLPFWGKVSVGYYPSEKILGLSKIPRIVNVYARRVQVQERLTQQICDALVELVAPRAVFVRMMGSHMCMMMRGVEKYQSQTLTEAGFGLEALSDYERQQLLNINVH